jgi:plastocyanin
VAASEFKFVLGGEPDGPGEYAFKLTNDGQTGHDLVVEGPGVRDERTPVIDPGESADLDVDLQAGEYTLYCSVPGHRDAGMETTIDIK